MTIAQSIVQKAEMILRICQWIEDDIAAGGYSTADSMGQTNMRLAASILQERADDIIEHADALLANAPSALEPNDVIPQRPKQNVN